MPLSGTLLGAASGALGSALTDFGINDIFMKELSANVQPGNAALFVLIHKMTTDKVPDAMKGTGGTVLKTSLDRTEERALRDVLPASPSGATPGRHARKLLLTGVDLGVHAGRPGRPS